MAIVKTVSPSSERLYGLITVEKAFSAIDAILFASLLFKLALVNTTPNVVPMTLVFGLSTISVPAIRCPSSSYILPMEFTTERTPTLSLPFDISKYPCPEG